MIGEKQNDFLVSNTFFFPQYNAMIELTSVGFFRYDIEYTVSDVDDEMMIEWLRRGFYQGFVLLTGDLYSQ